MSILIDQRNISYPTGKHLYTQSLIKSLRSLGVNLIQPPQASHPLKRYWQLYQTSKSTPLTISPLSYITSTIVKPAVCTVIYDLAAFSDSFSTNTKATIIEKALLPTVITKSIKLITISKAIQNQLAQKFNTHKIHLVSPYIAPPAKSYPWPNNLPRHPYFLFIGTLEPRKNLLNLIKATAIAHQTQKNLPHLVIIGKKGWQYQPIIDAINTHRHTVNYLGRVSSAQKQALLHHCQFLALPSFYEGFGLPVLEAIMHRKASLISHDPALKEVAGPTGHQALSTDIKAIAQGITNLSTDHAYRKHLEHHTLKHKNHYSQAAQQSQLQDLLISLGMTM